jgi:hypothetical protein
MSAHIMEHLGFQYRKGIEMELGVSLPSPDEKLPPELEAQIAALSAEAAQKLTQKNQAEAQQQQNEQAAQDPIVQMQQKELALKEQEINDKKAIELAKLENAKEIAMINNEAKLLLAGEDAKTDLMLKGAEVISQTVVAPMLQQGMANLTQPQEQPQEQPQDPYAQQYPQQ